MSAPKSEVIAVVGPTASGKTELALALARRLDGEILSADMGQLYRLLDAGTAKPAGRWEDGPGGKVFLVEGTPYHLVDALDPAEETDAGAYARRASAVLEDVLRRGRRPIVCGGTGLYVRALLEGLAPLPPRDPALRAELERRAAAEGRAALHAELERRDPDAARAIPPNNLQRVVRALEVCALTGKPFSALAVRPPAGERRAEYLAVERSPAELRERIRARTQEMFPRMVEEVRRLVPTRLRGDEPGFRCLGYPEAVACAAGRLAPAEGLAGMLRATLAYAKRQRTWFRGQTDARWLAPDADLDALAGELR
ncbi:MAG: tRNA (adenosine(37)-N6)-dimethylallyltransferase MiaA [Elusimicrobiota bacterium]|jgi:tRNA dimethylallyltransferase